jgi:hypothetical protein
MSPGEWSQHKSTIEKRLTRGKFDEARQAFAKIDREKIPDEGLADFRRLEDRFLFYLRLLAESSPGRLLPPPKLYKFARVSGKEDVAVLITSDEKSYYIETLSGIGTKLSRKSVKGEPVELTPVQAQVHAEEILENRCDGRGILRRKKDELIVEFYDNPKKNPPPNAMAYFDMADFCAENGLAELIPMLLDSARERDPNIVATAHEAKAERKIGLLKFYDKNHLKEDMNEEFKLLNARYFDTSVFSREIAWLQSKFGSAVRTEPPPPPPPPVEATRPIAGEPPKSPPAVPDFEGWERDYTGPLTLEEAKKKEASGDDLYKKGKQHLQNSDPNENPGGWIAENREALKFMTQASEEYDIAQTIHQKLGKNIPKQLLDKARETNMIRSMCRKRAVSKG